MGRRHQAFLIARVRPHGSPDAPPKYRCIAAYHHQCCYGRLPLHATRRLLTLVRQKENADIVRAELRIIDGKYGRYEEEPELPAVPCPFAAHLLGVSWVVDLATGAPAYHSGVTFKHSLLSAGMDSWDGDNNDGISVVDITNPENPAYCFLSESTPLSAEEYVRAYYAPPSRDQLDEADRRFEEDVLQTIAKLDGEKMVTMEMLAEAWPFYEYRGEAGRSATSTESVDHAMSANAALIPSLTSMTLGPALDHAIKIGDTREIEEMLWLPGKMVETKSILRTKSPFPDGAIELLLKVLAGLKETTSVDLCDFDLSHEQTVQVVSHLEGLKDLNISFNVQITTETLHEILTAAPGVKRLVLMGCSSIVSEELYALMRSQPKLFYHIEALMHPALLDVAEPPRYPIAFTFMTCHGHTLPTIRGCSLPIFTPVGIVQSLLDVFRSILSVRSLSFDLNGGTLFQAAVTARPRAPGVPWGERSVVAIPVLSADVLYAAQPGWAFLYQRSQRSTTTDNYSWCFLRITSTSASDAAEEPEGGWSAESSDPEAPGEDIGTNASKGKKKQHGKERPWLPKEWEIHDLRSFLRITTEEGRPAPSEEDVQELEELLHHQPRFWGALRVMDIDLLKEFVRDISYHKQVEERNSTEW